MAYAAGDRMSVKEGTHGVIPFTYLVVVIRDFVQDMLEVVAIAFDQHDALLSFVCHIFVDHRRRLSSWRCAERAGRTDVVDPHGVDVQHVPDVLAHL